MLTAAAMAFLSPGVLAQSVPSISAERVALGADGVHASRIAVRDPVSGRIVESIYSERTGRLLERRLYTPHPTPDLNRDGVVDARDLAALAARLGARATLPTTTRATPPDHDGSDLSQDGAVDSADLLILLEAIGESPEPTPTDIPTAAAITGGCMMQCPDGEWISCDSLCGLGTGPGDGTDGLGDGGDDCPEYDPECTANGGPGGGGGGGNNNNGNNDDDDDDDEQCEASSSVVQRDVTFELPDSGNFRQTLMSGANASPWLKDVQLTFASQLRLTEGETCCPESPQPPQEPLAFRSFHGNAQMAVSATFKHPAFSFEYSGESVIGAPWDQAIVLGRVKAVIDLGPRFTPTFSGNLNANGLQVIGFDCPNECVNLSGGFVVGLRLALVGTQGFEVVIGGPGTPWASCPSGFTFAASLSAEANTGITANAQFRTSECRTFAPGWTDRFVRFDGVSTAVQASAEATVHGVFGIRFSLSRQWDLIEDSFCTDPCDARPPNPVATPPAPCRHPEFSRRIDMIINIIYTRRAVLLSMFWVCAFGASVRAEPERVQPMCRSYASGEAGVTVAMQALVERLDSPADHDDAGPNPDRTCLACVCRVAIAAIRRGDAAGLASLYGDGSTPEDLRGYFAYDAEGRSMDPWAPNVRVVPIEATHAPWGARIAVFADHPGGASYGVGAFFAELDPATRQWWLTQQIGPQDFPFSGSLGQEIEHHDLAGLEAYRLVRSDSGNLSAIRLDNKPPIRDNDMFVYLRVERSPAGDAPLLSVAPESLDPSSAQLQHALHEQLLWLNGFDSSRDRMLAEYEPRSREIIRQELLPRRTANGMRPGIVAARRFDPTLLLAKLRMDARVEVGAGFVWFGHAQRLEPDADPSAAYVILHQIRTPDGGWSLLFREMDDADTAAQYCRRLLGASIGIGEAISRATPAPGD